MSLVLGKSRVTPINPVTILRLELLSAIVAVKEAITLNEEFTYENAEFFFGQAARLFIWCIVNERKRFYLFIANRVGFIHSNSDKGQWNYVPGS